MGHGSGTPEAKVADDLIGYEALNREAMRGIVRAALERAQGTKAMPGRHHFYITFRTKAPGVAIPDFLTERYPDEMTIVLEHQYWDLEIAPTWFRVILRFNGQPYPLTVPFAALTRFVDPSVPWGVDLSGDIEESVPANVAAPESPPKSGGTETDADGEDEGPRVVSLDAFRKK
jgi:uncharacterized protein